MLRLSIHLTRNSFLVLRSNYRPMTQPRNPFTASILYFRPPSRTNRSSDWRNSATTLLRPVNVRRKSFAWMQDYNHPRVTYKPLLFHHRNRRTTLSARPMHHNRARQVLDQSPIPVRSKELSFAGQNPSAQRICLARAIPSTLCLINSTEKRDPLPSSIPNLCRILPTVAIQGDSSRPLKPLLGGNS